jgi:uncharacterized protein (DUF433 family)
VNGPAKPVAGKGESPLSMRIAVEYNPRMETSVEKQHIVKTPGTCGGKARIAGHRIRVQDVALWTEEGRSPDEILGEFPQISLADVYAALAYYHDHRTEIDAEIQSAVGQ